MQQSDTDNRANCVSLRTAPGRDLSRVATMTATLPERVLLYAQTKWGKTSFCAMFRDAIFLTVRGEDGLQKLIESGQLPETPHFEDIAMSWAEVLQAVQSLRDGKHSFKTLVIDTANGA